MMPLNKSNSKPQPNRLSVQFYFDAIGTTWDITIDQPINPVRLAALRSAITERIAAFDATYSRFRSDSLVSRIAKQAGTYTFPEDAQPLIELYQQLYDITNGAMTPLIGQSLADAGYDADYSLRPGKLRMTPSWSEVLDYDHPQLTTNRPVLLDFGAAGKGYLVDIVSDLLANAGLNNYCVNAGGDMAIRTTKQPLAIGLEHPAHEDEVIGVATVKNQSICGSAGNRRAWHGFNHVLDPRTNLSPSHLRAVWVVAETTLLADALTTALYFTDPDTLGNYKFEYALLLEDYSLVYSENFPAEFFVNETKGAFA
jgi:thiamine biosynthesis lipoprotein